MTTPTNTPTPRTDKCESDLRVLGTTLGSMMNETFNFARLLERENQQLHREVAEAKKDTPTADAVIWKEACNKAVASRDHFKQLAEE